MSRTIFSIFDDKPANLCGKVLGLYVGLIAANLLAWGWAVVAFRDHPVLLGTALLAYSFGLRHAFDADHIAAIDNVTRKLMQDGKRPLGAGFFFSLGHSTVVAGLSIAVALTAAGLQRHFDWLKDAGSAIGTGVSASFLFAIATANIVIFAGVWRAFRNVRRGGKLVEEDLDMLLANRGLLARLFKRLFRLIEHSWQMYPLGLLFGLGFDTATEIGVLGITAAGAAHGLSLWSILIFPVLFAAGMSLADVTDGTLMLGAYGWAFVRPVRKLYYNLTVTFVSVVVAVAIGGVEALGLIASKLDLQGTFWATIGTLAGNFGLLGTIIVGIFVASWIISIFVYHLKGYDALEARATSG